MAENPPELKRLQSIKPSEIIFTKATPKQQTLAWELNGVSWAKPMSIENYITREAHLSSQDLTKDGKCTYWVLVLKDDPGSIIASCESTRKTLYIREPGQELRVGNSYAIASVYTNPDYRRLGMASLMLKRLQEEMDKDSDASALYSDIGKIYYGQLGWPAYPSPQATLHITPAKEGDGPYKSPVATRPLRKEDLPPLCERDDADTRARMAALPDDGKIHVAFAPSLAQIEWQLARESFMVGVIHPGRPIERRGAITEDGESWILWDHDWRENKLKVLRIVTPGPMTEERRAADAAVLLQAAMEEAAAWGLPKVLVWNPDEAITAAVKGVSNENVGLVTVVFDERLDGSIPCLRWKGGKGTENVTWEDNLYYAWC